MKPFYISAIFILILLLGFKHYFNPHVESIEVAPKNNFDFTFTESSILTTVECDVEQLVKPVQLPNLINAHDIGNEIGFPETVQAISYVESKSGHHPTLVGNMGARVGKRAYGIMQLKTAAARFVFTKYPKIFVKYFPGKDLKTLADEEIIALLLTNHEANVMIGALNFEIMTRYTSNWSHAVTAYYTGLEGSKSVDDYTKHFYVNLVRNAIEDVVRPVNSCLGFE